MTHKTSPGADSIHAPASPGHAQYPENRTLFNKAMKLRQARYRIEEALDITREAITDAADHGMKLAAIAAELGTSTREVRAMIGDTLATARRLHQDAE